MSAITKEWLKQKIADMKATRDEIPFGLDEDDSNTLAALRIALASLEAEPVEWRVSFRLDGQPGSDFEKTFENQAKMNEIISLHERAGFSASITPFYTAPPAPVSVPDVLKRLRSIVADPRALPRRKEWISGQQYSYVPLENVEAMIDEACRAAMLQAGNHTEQHLDMVVHSGDDNEKNDCRLPFDQWLSQQHEPIDVDCGCVTTEAFYHWLRVAYEAGNSPVIGIDMASEPDRSVEVRYLALPGYVMVPKEITCAMDDAAWEAYHETRCMSDIWAALLAAAPQQEVK